MLINNTKTPVAFFLFYFLKNPLEDYSIHKKWYFSMNITCWAVSMRYVWRKLDIIHVWTSDKLITVANVNTCLLIESLKEYSNFVIKYSTERDKSGRRRLHEDTVFWVVCSVNSTLTTPLPCVHSSTSLPIHTFQFFLCNFYWSQAVEFKNKHKLLFASFFGCEITGSVLSVLVFGYTVKFCYLPPVRVSEWMDCLKVVN